jgi:TolB protein
MIKAIRPSLLIRCGSALALLMLTLAARAQLTTIEIVKGEQRRTPVAVVPFGWSSPQPAPFDLAQVVSDDLLNSSKFDPLKRQDMVGDLPTTGSAIRFQDWRTLNSEYIVIGSVKPEGTRFRADFGLYNVLTGQRMFEKTVTTDMTTWRRTAHAIADQVYEAITGVRGVFSTRIAYVRAEKMPGTTALKQSFKLIVADYDDYNRVEVAKSTEPLMSPAWSPDGQSLAYVSFENKVSAIYVQTLRTGERRLVSARAGINGAPAWSPDGSTLALTLSRKDGDVDVYTLQLASQVLTRMTFDPGIDTEPQWSLDGRSLFFSSDRAGSPQIYQIDVSQPDKPKRITYEGTYNARPRLSPDGKLIATVHLDEGNFRIALTDISTGAATFRGVLTQGRQDESPSFAPNGDLVIYATQERGRGVLANVTTDGRTGPRLLDASGGDVREPVWAPFVQK